MFWLRFLLVLIVSQQVYAAKPQLVIGATLPLSGPMIEYGQMVKDGINAALQEAIRRDPTLKSRIRLEILDDAGDPQKADENAKKLITQLNAQVLIGCVGERICASVERVAVQAGVPLLGLVNANDDVCKAGSLAYCLHASYADEAESISKQLKSQGIKRVHLWVSPELVKYQSKISGILEEARFVVKATRSDVANANAQFLDSTSLSTDEAHLFLLNNKDAVEAIKSIRQRNSRVLVGAFSSIEPYRWLQKSQNFSVGAFLANSMPNPDLGKTMLVKNYQAALAAYSQFNLPYEYAQLEIYVVGRMLVTFTRQGFLGRQAIIAALGKAEVPVDEISIGFKGSKRNLEMPVSLSVVGRNGVLMQ